MLSTNEIRDMFLKFYKNKQHNIYESASLIPDDPTILLTIAGMVPFKQFFMGKKESPYKKVVSCQKCIRTNDLENVGMTARHHTFFEMLGNFSFGDYFKEDAIKWAWEFLTEELKLPKEKLWISVYKDDEESIKIWNEQVKVPLERIVKMGDEDNFWQAGPTGPCGPSSEIYIDLGEEKGCGLDTCAVGCDCDRYMEIWNLVFTEYDRQEDGSLKPLPKKNIDTGMGLERIASVMQNVDSNFDIDLIKPIIEEVAKKTGVKYNEKKEIDFSLKIIADHLRAIVFLIGDGVLPSNDGRGYILRRILRRAARHGRLLGYNNKVFLYHLIDIVIKTMEYGYPELKKQREHIKKVISIEEEKFARTLDFGLSIADEEIKKLKKENKTKIDSKIVFKLYDTYGFPFELTEEICQENNIEISFDEFKKEMEKQKERARNSREVISEKIEDSFIEKFYEENGRTKFVGYDKDIEEASILHIKKISDNELEIITDKTPFYAESGGQISDVGIIENATFMGEVKKVYKRKDVFIHIVKVKNGELQVSENVEMKIDVNRRRNIEKNHTATHLLQAALHEVVGGHVHQEGSLVQDDRLRFDCSHYEALKKEEIEEIERIVNENILKNIEVKVEEKSMAEAKEMGAIALFDNKYGKIVRVVDINNTSTELCGGTHVNSIGEIGLFKILTENGVASGVRRIEAVTGQNALKYVRRLENSETKIAELLKTDKEKIIEKVNQNLENNKKLEKEIEKLKSQIASFEMNEILEKPMNINGVNVILKSFKNQDVSTLRQMMDKGKEKLKSCIIVFGTNNGKAIFMVGVTKDLIQKGIKAGDLVREISKIAEGNGGGRPDFAQAGGKNGSKVNEAIEFAKKMIEEKL